MSDQLLDLIAGGVVVIMVGWTIVVVGLFIFIWKRRMFD